MLKRVRVMTTSIQSVTDYKIVHEELPYSVNLLNNVWYFYAPGAGPVTLDDAIMEASTECKAPHGGVPKWLLDLNLDV